MHESEILKFPPMFRIKFRNIFLKVPVKVSKLAPFFCMHWMLLFLNICLGEQQHRNIILHFVRVVLGSGKFEEIMVASQEIAGSTAQLVIASRVKAKEGSNKFHELKLASRVVTEATGAVVAVAKSSSVTAESKESLKCIFQT